MLLELARLGTCFAGLYSDRHKNHFGGFHEKTTQVSQKLLVLWLLLSGCASPRLEDLVPSQKDLSPNLKRLQELAAGAKDVKYLP